MTGLRIWIARALLTFAIVVDGELVDLYAENLERRRRSYV